jgi:hypothetical protein
MLKNIVESLFCELNKIFHHKLKEIKEKIDYDM